MPGLKPEGRERPVPPASPEFSSWARLSFTAKALWIEGRVTITTVPSMTMIAIERQVTRRVRSCLVSNFDDVGGVCWFDTWTVSISLNADHYT